MLRWFLLLWKQKKCPIQKNGIAYVRDYTHFLRKEAICGIAAMIKLKSLPAMLHAPPFFCSDYNQVVDESIFLNLSDTFGNNISEILSKLWPCLYYLII